MEPTQLTLQRLILPDLSICTEFDLYVRQEGAVSINLQESSLVFGVGGIAQFNTYINLFNLGNWQRHCLLPGLALHLAGEGRFQLRIWRTRDDLLARELCHQEKITLQPRGQAVDLSHLLEPADAPIPDGLLLVTFEALSDGILKDARFTAPTHAPTQDAETDPSLRLAISITTFRREDDVARTAERVSKFLEGPGADILAAAGAEAHLFIVDNGQSAQIDPHPLISLISNANLGGAGGFARGLAAAEDGGFTHCLFMDDDASFEMENLVRTVAFLALARNPRTAVAGSMIVNSRKWAMWENGAVFNRSCKPRYMGTDLRDLQHTTAMEIDSARPKPPHFYGGWWYFAFPIGHVKHYPFPFFVRGDDISFSLANDFEIATINGVVSFQDDFAAKESALTLYLDLRNHLHHHMTHANMQIGVLRTLRIFWRFYLRSIVRLHYETAEAQIIAMEDIMKGPAFFDANADMMEKRPQITGLIKTEKWQPADPATSVPAESYHPPGRLRSQLMKLTLNGHLLPGWGRKPKARRILLRDRGLIWPLWGVTVANFVDYDKGLSYTVRFDRRRFLTLTRRAIKISRAFYRNYDALCAAYAKAYPETTQRGFWQKLFNPAKADDPAA